MKTKKTTLKIWVNLKFMKSVSRLFFTKFFVYKFLNTRAFNMLNSTSFFVLCYNGWKKSFFQICKYWKVINLSDYGAFLTALWNLVPERNTDFHYIFSLIGCNHGCTSSGADFKKGAAGTELVSLLLSSSFSDANIFQY